eukprot:15309332-Alexandrium_andersonii.AAC.1
MEPHRNHLGTSRTARFVVRFEISANNGAERTPRELQGSILRPLMGSCSSSSERLKQFCRFGSSSSERLSYGVNTGRYS